MTKTTHASHRLAVTTLAAMALDMASSQDGPPTDLASTYRAFYRAQFFASLDPSSNNHSPYHGLQPPAAAAATGPGVHGGRTGARPFLIPLYLCGVYLIPALYLAIPHRSGSRRWLYAARWPLLAGLTWFHVQMILHVSSPNFASAYAVGLLGAWGVIWNWTVLVWTAPQWDAKRVERRVGSKGKGQGSVAGSDSRETEEEEKEEVLHKTNGNGHTNGYTNGHNNGGANGLKHRQNGVSKHENGYSKKLDESSPDSPNNDPGQIEYFWQPFPEHAPFLTRFNWSFDYVGQFRMTGWNCAIPSLPTYAPPAYKGAKQQSLDTLPNRSRDGYTRVVSSKTWIYNTLVFSILPSYVVIDLLAILVTNDPHFVISPDHNAPLPSHLAALHPLARFLFRQIIALFAIIAALHLVLNFGHLLICLLCRPLLGFRAEPWHLPSMTGSFTQVLDRGLTGFWGSWWHQTFRFGFAAPTKWLLRRGYIAKGTLAADIVSFSVAFAQSGFLHAAASYSTVPAQSRWWMPPVTFLMSGLGMIVQKNIASQGWKYLDAYYYRVNPDAVQKGSNGGDGGGKISHESDESPSRAATPIWARRMGNVAFVLVWLSLTAWPLLDDFSRAGIWLFDPVPVSLFRHRFARAVFRGLGIGGADGALGDPLDRRVWRWDRDFFPRRYSGRSWFWDTGLGV